MNKILIAIVMVLAAACDRGSSEPASRAPAATVLPAGMTRVADPSQVCMVNDQFMGRPQIPVEVEGRTYYGCCPDCKTKLDQQPAIRTAADPVSGEAVDKAKAIIVQDATGKVLYFASEDTLRRYRG
ncbi:MAG TPA: TRASH domain-containing protein [Kofleriaceae bacterium]|nr:TRASH domain-containing protein [Kofleriaceae bacterium]